MQLCTLIKEDNFQKLLYLGLHLFIAVETTFILKEKLLIVCSFL